MLRTHGLSNSKAYSIWAGIKKRCLNPNRHEYPHYGGAGIGVCRKWLRFEGFFEDMGHPGDGMTIDRIDNTKGYSKKNCRWASYGEQLRNQRRSRRITYKGKTMCMTDWAIAVGLHPSTIHYRIKRGLPVSKVLAPGAGL